jgi:hypothetical protein
VESGRWTARSRSTTAARFVYIDESDEHRLAKAGYPRGTGELLREARYAERDAAAKARYIATYRS